MLVDQGRRQSPESTIICSDSEGQRNIQYRFVIKTQTKVDDGKNVDNVPGSLGDHAPHQVVGSCKKGYSDIHAVCTDHKYLVAFLVVFFHR